MNKQKIREKPVVLLASAVLLLGLGGAAIQTVVSPTATGDVTVEKGFDLAIKDVTDGTVNDEQSFTLTKASGSTFNVSYVKENLANDKTEGLVEPYVLDMSGTSLDTANIERIDFDAVQTATEEEGSTVPKGRTANFTMVWDSQGNLVTDKSSGYYDITSSDYDNDQESEIVICVGDDNGMKFGPNERWEANQRVDTRSTFPTGDVTATLEMVSMYNPSTGSYSEEALACGQYSK